MANDVTTLGVDECPLESAASCLDVESVRALGDLQLSEAAEKRLNFLAEQANEGRLTSEEAREYDRFIGLGDIIAALRLKAERHIESAKAG